MEERYGRAGRIWAVDRGMIDAANLEWLKERGSRYIVGTPKGELKRFEQELLKGTWHEIREGLEVRTVPDEAGSETFILCRSADRAAKERAMRERFEQRIEKGLQAIVRRCEQKRCDLGVIERRIGRLLGKNTRAARLFSVQVGRDESGRVVRHLVAESVGTGVGEASRGLLPAAEQCLGLDGRGSLEGLHAIDGSRGRVPDPERRVATATGVASDGGRFSPIFSAQRCR